MQVEVPTSSSRTRARRSPRRRPTRRSALAAAWGHSAHGSTRGVASHDIIRSPSWLQPAPPPATTPLTLPMAPFPTPLAVLRTVLVAGGDRRRHRVLVQDGGHAIRSGVGVPEHGPDLVSGSLDESLAAQRACGQFGHAVPTRGVRRHGGSVRCRDLPLVPDVSHHEARSGPTGADVHRHAADEPVGERGDELAGIEGAVARQEGHDGQLGQQHRGEGSRQTHLVETSPKSSSDDPPHETCGALPVLGRVTSGRVISRQSVGDQLNRDECAIRLEHRPAGDRVFPLVGLSGQLEPPIRQADHVEVAGPSDGSRSPLRQVGDGLG